MSIGLTRSVQNWLPERAKGRVGLAVFVSLVCVSVVGLDAWNLGAERARAEQAGRDQATNVVRAQAQHAEDTIRAVDAILLGTVERLQADGTSMSALLRLNAVIRAREAAMPQLKTITVWNAAGDRMTASRELRPSGVNIFDRPSFQFHRNHPDLGLHVGMPVRGRVSEGWIIPLSRRFDSADGRFAGIAVAALDIAEFGKFLAGFAIGQGGTLLLTDTEGTLLVRRPLREGDLGKRLGQNSSARLLPEGPSGFAEVTSPADGVVRMISYQRSQAYPIVSVAALSVDEVFAPWWADVRRHAVAVTLLIIGILALGLRLAWQIGLRLDAQRTAEAATAQYRLLAEHSNDMIFRLDLEFRRRYVSPASRELLGYAPEELLGAAPLTIIHPEDAGRVAEIHRQMAAGLERGATINRIRHKDGHWVWVESACRLVRDPRSGEGIGIVGALRDVTARIEAEQKARLSDARATLVLEATNDIVFAVDHEWHVTYANSKAVWNERFRLLKEPTTLWEIDPEMLGTAFERCCRAVMEERRPMEVTAPFRRNRVFKACVTPAEENGGIVVFVADVTAVKQLEESLVREREGAVAVARAKSEFLANMSHELRTPLNAVIGFAELIEQGEAHPAFAHRHREYAADIRHSGEHLLGLINEILDYSKAEAGELSLNWEVFDPATLVQSCVRTMAPRAMHKNVEVITALGECPSSFVGDQKRIRQILLNLLTNALKFTPANGRIEIRAWWQDTLVMTVRDTGIGIPQDELVRVMEPFTQVDNDHTRSQEGTGLGLPLSRRLAEMHGGTLHIDSAVGVGTLVTLTLPNRKPAGRDCPPPIRRRTAPFPEPAGASRWSQSEAL